MNANIKIVNGTTRRQREENEMRALCSVAYENNEPDWDIPSMDWTIQQRQWYLREVNDIKMRDYSLLDLIDDLEVLSK